ncbi:heme-binding protein [Winogradskyella sp.]|uniref:heme-binding protein n=1 Tax=Winogradskyella sp. TaxID=1883156 RepID=UPI0025D1D8E6|nr:heme-binding protein [Winogradskyella sp.]MCJ8281347.1 heme-binding protein [Rivularia sp. ALOHA_DT_140]
MKSIIPIILFFGILANLTAQNKDMKQDILKKIELDSFNNQTGLKMGLAILNLAKERHQNIAVKVERLNHTIFLFVDDNLPADKHLWLRRKANVAKHFEESSLSVKNDLVNGNMTLEKTFALDITKFLAKGGSIPVFVKSAGMVAIITVSGLHDEEDHKIIIDALKGEFIK